MSGSEGTTPDTRQIRRVIISALAGSTVEWYDFIVFGTLSALVFRDLFYPELSATVGTIAALGTFAVGFVARPLGAVLFGRLGDRVGRKTTLIVTLTTMALATAAIGLLPTYETIGATATALLNVLRFVQGISLGGEWGGAALLAVEHATDRNRGRMGGFPQMGGSTGPLLGTLVVTAVTAAMAAGSFQAWGWRLPLLLALPLIGVGLYMRLGIEDSPVFVRMKRRGVETSISLVAVFRQSGRSVLLIAGMYLASVFIFYVNAVFVVSYATGTLGMRYTDVLIGNIIALAVAICIVIPLASLSDRLGRRPIYLAGTIGLMAIAFPYFWLINTHSVPMLWLALLLGSIVGTAPYAIQPAYFSELLPVSGRYSALSIAVQGATVLAGSTAPIVATFLVSVGHGSTHGISLYMILLGAISTIAVLGAGETLGKTTQDATDDRLTKLTDR